jgi:hypothetical protein
VTRSPSRSRAVKTFSAASNLYEVANVDIELPNPFAADCALVVSAIQV